MPERVRAFSGDRPMLAAGLLVAAGIALGAIADLVQLALLRLDLRLQARRLDHAHAAAGAGPHRDAGGEQQAGDKHRALPGERMRAPRQRGQP